MSDIAVKLWANPANLMDIEKALDARCLYIAITNGRWWLARRNGATRKWVTRPDEYRVPIKYGLRGAGGITHDTSMDLMRIAGTREDAETAS